MLAQAFLFHINPLARAEEPSAEEAARLESIITENETSVQKLESSPLYAAYTWHSTSTLAPMPGPDGADFSGQMIAEGRARYWRNGTSFCLDRDLKNTWPATGKVTDGSSIFLINDHYAVIYTKNLSVVDRYYFKDKSQVSPSVKELLKSSLYPDILRFGTRYGTEQTLKEVYDKEVGGGKVGYSWMLSEIESAGNPQFKIVGERLGAAQKRLQKEIVVDPQCGSLISESRTYNKSGEPFFVVQARFAQTPDGTWFPKSATRNIDQGQNTLTIEVQELSLGDPEIENKITLEALDIDRESLILQEHTSGDTKGTMKGYLDGQWVPYDSLPQERKDAISDARRKKSARLENDDTQSGQKNN